MAIKDLLVAYDGNDGSQKAARFAVQMANKYGAKITGIHVYQPEKYESHIKRWIPESVLKGVRDAEKDAEKTIEESFNTVVTEAGFKGEASWISSTGHPNTMLPRYARYFDLLIVGQFTHILHDGIGSLDPAQLLSRSGKAMIVVPLTYEAQPFKEEAVVAWDGSRSAARALTDAMQILETKKRLDVVRLIASEKEEPNRVLPEHDLIAHLQSHGINANLVSIVATGSNVGPAILKHCAEMQPDVLVMGAYGRGKFGQMFFGSTTKYILENMTTPVLMSH